MPLTVVAALGASGCFPPSPAEPDAGEPGTDGGVPSSDPDILVQRPDPSMRFDEKSCGGPGERCQQGESCWEGVCLPEYALLGGGNAQPSTAIEGVWILRGPAIGGRLAGIMVSGDAPEPGERTVVVGSPGGGLWRRPVDGSRRWRRLGARLSDAIVVHVEADLRNPSRLYAATWSRLYLSDDLGETWRAVAGRALPRVLPAYSSDIVDRGHPFAQLALFDGDRFVLYAPPCDGVHGSSDGEAFGRSLIVPSDPSSADNCVANIAADAATGFVWVSTHGPDPGVVGPREPAHIYRTCLPCVAGLPCPRTDPCPPAGGPPWVFAGTGLVEDAADHVASLAVTTPSGPAGSDTPRLTAMLNVGSNEQVWETVPDSNGRRWQRVRSRAGLADDCPPVGARPPPDAGPVCHGDETPRPLLHAGGLDLIHGSTLVWHSADLGRSWSYLEPALPGTGLDLHPDPRALYLDQGPGQETRLWVATDGAGAPDSVEHRLTHVNIASYRFRASLELDDPRPLDTAGLVAWQTYFVVPTRHPRFAERVYRWVAGSQDNSGLCAEADPLLPALPRGEVDRAPVALGDQFAATVAGSNLLVVASRMARSRNFFTASSCAGVVWDVLPSLPSRLAYPSNNTLAVQPGTQVVHVALSPFGYATHDFAAPDPPAAGVFWRTHDRPRPGGRVLHHRSIDVGRDGSVFLGTAGDGVYVRPGAGLFRVWRPWALTDDPPEAVHVLRGGGMWIGTTRGLFRRAGPGMEELVLPPVDRGAGIAFSVSDVEVDPHCPTRMYAAAGYGGVDHQHGHGLFLSTDGGRRWEAMATGTDVWRTPITDVTVAPDDERVVYVATYGQGVWAFVWTGPLPECAP